MFRRVLIANRGEIAVRIARSLREMGITSVAAFSDADRDALFVHEADEAYRLGEAPAPDSYLNVDRLISAARKAGVAAVHPGYGFLSENAGFARAVADAGLTFIGPTPEAIALMGDKVQARQAVAALGVPVVPGTPGPVGSLEEALAFAEGAGYPVAVKASGGGGGRGIRVVNSARDMAEALERARREAQSYFRNPEVYLERYFAHPRHVEIQVFGDRHGTLIHLGERDCSVQRRHQKLIEETPSPAVDRDLRARMGEMAIRAASAANYTSAGTVEFLLADDGTFYFLEMNTRIQVEHPVTEAVTGVDLIREMILSAAGEHIELRDSVVDLRGHAIEVRINAEDPLRGFAPTPAPIERYMQPGGPGIRVDSGVYPGYTVPPDYDSLMSKLIAWAPDRERARVRMLRALQEYVIDGPASTIPFARAVLESDAFAGGKATTTFVGECMTELEAAARQLDRGLWLPAPGQTPSDTPRLFDVDVNGRAFTVRVTEREQQARQRRARHRQGGAAGPSRQNAVISPMHGVVVAIKRQVGDRVAAGETVFVIEAMKMENEVGAPRDATLARIAVQTGQSVDSGQTLAELQ